MKRYVPPLIVGLVIACGVGWIVLLLLTLPVWFSP